MKDGCVTLLKGVLMLYTMNAGHLAFFPLGQLHAYI
jgi:hypothetical protein